jgi:hypothetical protein
MSSSYNNTSGEYNAYTSVPLVYSKSTQNPNNNSVNPFKMI